MKILNSTLSALKSFTSINPSIYVKEGNVIKTMSPQKTIIASAVVDDTFDANFGIYDLNQFLSAISIFSDPDFEFDSKSVKISSGSASIQYGFADENMIIQAPDKDLVLPDTVVEFTLTDQVFKQTIQAANVLQLPNWSVKGEDGKIMIVVGDAKDNSSNAFRHEVGETDAEFDLVFKIENLKFMPNTYNVKISSKGISHFATENKKIQYFIATESK